MKTMSLQANLSQSVQEFTVSEISSKIKNIVEGQCGYVRIKGEISGLKIATSGHGYMNLKDDGAVLAAICWRGTLSKLKFQIEEGMEVVASGKITTYAGQSKYQLSIENIEPAGKGALMKMLIQRKQKLEQEGLFDKSRKKPLPFLPKRIGIVTSPTGAVIRDMLHRIEDRFPVHVIVWPAAVQGEASAGEIEKAIYGLNNLDDAPDLIIVARGGGSIEDLWSFNEENVVRAVANSNIPIISAIGHETDFTLSDFAADVRAPTPTAAAEFAVPVLEDLKYTLSQNFQRLKDIISNIISYRRKIVEICENTLSNPMRMINVKEQNLDYTIFKLLDLLPNIISKKNMRLEAVSASLAAPKNLLDMRRINITHLGDSLRRNLKNTLSLKSQKIDLQKQLLGSLNYNNVLKRGFAIIKKGDSPVTSITDLESGLEASITMHDGEKKVTIK